MPAIPAAIWYMIILVNNCINYLTKLPSNVRLVVSRNVPDDDWNLDSLMNVIKEEINVRERANSVPVLNCTTKKPSHDGQPTAVFLFVKGSTLSCVYCDQNCHLSLYKTVMDAEQLVQATPKEILEILHLLKEISCEQKLLLCFKLLYL